VILHQGFAQPAPNTAITVSGYGLGDGTTIPTVTGLDFSGSAFDFSVSGFNATGGQVVLTLNTNTPRHAGDASINYQINGAVVSSTFAQFLPMITSPATPPMSDSNPGRDITLTGYALGVKPVTFSGDSLIIQAKDAWNNTWLCDWQSSTTDGKQAVCRIGGDGPQEPGVAQFQATNSYTFLTSTDYGKNVHMRTNPFFFLASAVSKVFV